MIIYFFVLGFEDGLLAGLGFWLNVSYAEIRRALPDSKAGLQGVFKINRVQKKSTP